MKLKKLSASIFFTPKGAIIVFAVMIVAILVVNRVKGRQVLRARAIRRARRAGVRNAYRSVPLYAYKGIANPNWRRQWDQMSGSSRFSRDGLQGRKMGMHLHTA